MKSKNLKLSIAKILTVVSIVGMMSFIVGPKLGLDVCQVHAEGPGDGTDDEKSGNCLTQEEAVKLVQDENNYSHRKHRHHKHRHHKHRHHKRRNLVFTIPDNYDSIAPHAFDPEINKGLATCSNLENVRTIVVGSKVGNIGESAFEGCKIRKIILPENLKSLGNNGNDDEKSGNCLTQEEAVKLVQDENNYSLDEQGNVMFTIPDNYDSIAPNAFNCKVNKRLESCEKWGYLNKGTEFCDNSLTFEIRLGSKVKEISEQAFAHCNMHKIVLSKGIKSIGERAFWFAEQLTEITIPENLTYIPPYCFSYCNKLEKVNFVNSANIKSIGTKAFGNCSSIKEFTVPGNIDSIPPYCFSGCANLKKINFVNSTNIESIGTQAFQGTKLKKFTVPPNVDSISRLCFWNCKALGKINFADPSKIQSIENGAFSNCSSMQEITIPENIGSISVDCFRACSALETVNFANPDNIKSIEKCAFNGCSNLQQFTIPGNVETISHSCFLTVNRFH